MKLREFINTDQVYKAVESKIRTWVEKSYPGLSIDFEPHLEVVQIDKKARFTKSRIPKIIEVINIKIGDIMEQYAEEIYIAERLDRIYKNHPDFDIEVTCIEDIKSNKQFLDYLKELII